MKKILTKLISLGLVAFMGSLAVAAQSFYDDDIYYDAAKAKKEKQAKAEKAAREAVRRNYVPSQPITDYPGADTYNFNTGNTRDVDEYNRRYSIGADGKEVTDSISLDQFTGGDFVNTRRIERFSNPDVISGSGDQELMDYYYSSVSNPGTTIVINNVDPWYYGGVYSPWYNGYYSYNPWRYGWNSWYPGYYDPWYGPSWSWGWGPSWSWSWGWGGGWHGPGWGHPVHGPIWGGNTWRPSSPGASRPHTPGGVKPSTLGRRPGNSYYGSGSSRPAYTIGNGSSNTVSGSRVNPTTGRRPSTVNSGTNANSSSGSNYRGGATVPGSRANQGRSSGTYNNSNNNNSNYNNNSSWGTRNSGSSWGSGSSGRSSGGSGSSGRSSGGGRSGRH